MNYYLVQRRLKGFSVANLTDLFDESARLKVREDETVSGWSVGLVIFGICLTLPTLYIGATAAHNLGITSTIQAVAIASVDWR